MGTRATVMETLIWCSPATWFQTQSMRLFLPSALGYLWVTRALYGGMSLTLCPAVKCFQSALYRSDGVWPTPPFSLIINIDIAHAHYHKCCWACPKRIVLCCRSIIFKYNAVVLKMLFKKHNTPRAENQHFALCSHKNQSKHIGYNCAMTVVLDFYEDNIKFPKGTSSLSVIKNLQLRR